MFNFDVMKGYYEKNNELDPEFDQHSHFFR